jgi:hypothetical protein
MMPDTANNSRASAETAARTSSGERTNHRMLDELAKTRALIRPRTEHRPSGEIFIRAPKGTVDRVASVFSEHGELTGEGVRAETKLRRHPKEAIRTLEHLGFLGRVGKTKLLRYHLTDTGRDYVKASQSARPPLLLGALLSNRDFVGFWSAFSAARTEFSTRDLRDYLHGTYDLSPSTCKAYAGYAISFLGYSQLVVQGTKRSKRDYEIVKTPGLDKFMAEQRPAEFATTIPAVRPQPDGVRQASYHDLKHSLFESATRLAEVYHSDRQFESGEDRAEVAREVREALATFSGEHGAMFTLVSLAEKEAVRGLRDADRETVKLAFQLMAALAKLASQKATNTGI